VNERQDGKEVKKMKYAKPEVAVLASAIHAVKGQMSKSIDPPPDFTTSTTWHTPAAYEADE